MKGKYNEQKLSSCWTSKFEHFRKECFNGLHITIQTLATMVKHKGLFVLIALPDFEFQRWNEYEKTKGKC